MVLVIVKSSAMIRAHPEMAFLRKPPHPHG